MSPLQHYNTDKSIRRDKSCIRPMYLRCYIKRLCCLTKFDLHRS
ncbi:hypothetical protein Desac_2267 [Desulfobacca acetoxidans DSM 11109]|uniref:Uncharacterized protein n=1 Tax=Desulfobacca acetoxidans (strain ATCC 700848 / DSM 11109 / ASRB2) TaxID=880072 RepID=F2NFH2_DESAR|nr:hypothetical protein Desac_2267 [Desulfobacca acetoxidans DSM 11109]